MKSNFLLRTCVIMLSIVIIAFAAMAVRYFSQSPIILFGIGATMFIIGIYGIIKTNNN